MVAKKFTLDAVEVTDVIILDPDNRLTFGINGSGTVIAQAKITDDGEWFDIQTCADGVLYSSVTGAKQFRFNQTVASGDTICEFSTGR